MKIKLLLIFAAVIYASTVATAAAGNITGQVVDEKSYAITPIEVSFHDAVNAEVIATATTDKTGAYDSGDLSDGDYKVRFRYAGDRKATAHTYISEYFGAGGADVFFSGTAVPVANGVTTIINETMVEIAWPRGTLCQAGTISGQVVDAATGAPLGNIEVRFFDSTSAERLFIKSAILTDVDGYYSRFTCSTVEYKVRFVDNLDSYLPQYYGAGGADDFNLGSPVSWESLGIDADMNQQSPSDVIGDLNDIVTDTGMSAQLDQAVNLLNDTNPNNDSASCGVLTGFINQVNAQERRGELTTEQADELRLAVEEVKTLIGCK